MPRKANYNRDEVLADWKTGKYSTRKLANKHRISSATVHGIVAGIEKSLEPLIIAEVAIKQELANLNEQDVQKFEQEVQERTKHLNFFTDAAVLNVKQAMETPCESHSDYKLRAETISKGKDVAVGKDPQVAIANINSATANAAVIPDFIREMIETR